MTENLSGLSVEYALALIDSSEAGVQAHGVLHELAFDIPIAERSWVALRHFPQLLHTNPVIVRVGGQPVRASKRSARRCIVMTERLWENRGQGLAATERAEAEATLTRAIPKLHMIADECVTP